MSERASIAECDECGEGSDAGERLCWDCRYELERKQLLRATQELAVKRVVLDVVRRQGGSTRNALHEAVKVAGVTANRVVFHTALNELVDEGYLVDIPRASQGSNTLIEPVEEFRFDSQVEVDFWAAYRRLRPWPLRGLLPNQWAHPYRVDFAINRRKFGIEIDGLAYHNGQDSFMKDRKRQRDLEIAGWRIARFAAKEIMQDAEACVREAAEQAEALVIA